MLTHINSNITSMEGMDSSIQRILRQVILETNQVLEGIAFVYGEFFHGTTEKCIYGWIELVVNKIMTHDIDFLV